MDLEKAKFRKKVLKLNERGRFIGLNVFDGDFKSWNYPLLFLNVNIIVSFCVSAYSFKIYSDNLDKMVFCFVTFGFLVKAVVQLASIVGQKEKFVKTMKDIEFLYDIFHSSDDAEIPKIFKKFNGYVDLSTKLLDITYISTGILSLLYPLVVKLVTGELVLPYGFELPFVDPFSLYGYTLNIVITSLWVTLAIVGFRISDTYFIMTFMPIYAMFDVLHYLIDDLNNSESKIDRDKDNDFQNFDVRKRKIVEIHQKLLIFISDVEKFYNISNFIIISTIYSQCVASSFALIVAKWYIGALFVAALLLQIFIFCLFGTFLEACQTEFREKITELNWPDKNISQKRKMLFILTTTAKTLQLTYLFGVLNFKTFMSVSVIF